MEQSKPTLSEIREILAEHAPDDLNDDMDFDEGKDIGGLFIKVIKTEWDVSGSDGDGRANTVIFTVNNDPQLYRLEQWFDSWSGGGDWEYDAIHKVVAREKTITVYETV